MESSPNGQTKSRTSRKPPITKPSIPKGSKNETVSQSPSGAPDASQTLTSRTARISPRLTANLETTTAKATSKTSISSPSLMKTRGVTEKDQTSPVKCSSNIVARHQIRDKKEQSVTTPPTTKAEALKKSIGGSQNGKSCTTREGDASLSIKGNKASKKEVGGSLGPGAIPKVKTQFQRPENTASTLPKQVTTTKEAVNSVKIRSTPVKQTKPVVVPDKPVSSSPLQFKSVKTISSPGKLINTTSNVSKPVKMDVGSAKTVKSASLSTKPAKAQSTSVKSANNGSVVAKSAKSPSKTTKPVKNVSVPAKSVNTKSESVKTVSSASKRTGPIGVPVKSPSPPMKPLNSPVKPLKGPHEGKNKQIARVSTENKSDCMEEEPKRDSDEQNISSTELANLSTDLTNTRMEQIKTPTDIIKTVNNVLGLEETAEELGNIVEETVTLLDIPVKPSLQPEQYNVKSNSFLIKTLEPLPCIIDPSQEFIQDSIIEANIPLQLQSELDESNNPKVPYIKTKAGLETIPLQPGNKLSETANLTVESTAENVQLSTELEMSQAKMLNALIEPAESPEKELVEQVHSSEELLDVSTRPVQVSDEDLNSEETVPMSPEIVNLVKFAQGSLDIRVESDQTTMNYITSPEETKLDLHETQASSAHQVHTPIESLDIRLVKPENLTKDESYHSVEVDDNNTENAMATHELIGPLTESVASSDDKINDCTGSVNISDEQVPLPFELVEKCAEDMTSYNNTENAMATNELKGPLTESVASSDDKINDCTGSVNISDEQVSLQFKSVEKCAEDMTSYNNTENAMATNELIGPSTESVASSDDNINDCTGSVNISDEQVPLQFESVEKCAEDMTSYNNTENAMATNELIGPSTESVASSDDNINDCTGSVNISDEQVPLQFESVEKCAEDMISYNNTENAMATNELIGPSTESVASSDDNINDCTGSVNISDEQVPLQFESVEKCAEDMTSYNNTENAMATNELIGPLTESVASSDDKINDCTGSVNISDEQVPLQFESVEKCAEDMTSYNNTENAMATNELIGPLTESVASSDDTINDCTGSVNISDEQVPLQFELVEKCTEGMSMEQQSSKTQSETKNMELICIKEQNTSPEEQIATETASILDQKEPLQNVDNNLKELLINFSLPSENETIVLEPENKQTQYFEEVNTDLEATETASMPCALESFKFSEEPIQCQEKQLLTSSEQIPDCVDSLSLKNEQVNILLEPINKPSESIILENITLGLDGIAKASAEYSLDLLETLKESTHHVDVEGQKISASEPLNTNAPVNTTGKTINKPFSTVKPENTTLNLDETVSQSVKCTLNVVQALEEPLQYVDEQENSTTETLSTSTTTNIALDPVSKHFQTLKSSNESQQLEEVTTKVFGYSDFLQTLEEPVKCQLDQVTSLTEQLTNLPSSVNVPSVQVNIVPEQISKPLGLVKPENTASESEEEAVESVTYFIDSVTKLVDPIDYHVEQGESQTESLNTLESINKSADEVTHENTALELIERKTESPTESLSTKEQVTPSMEQVQLVITPTTCVEDPVIFLVETEKPLVQNITSVENCMNAKNDELSENNVDKVPWPTELTNETDTIHMKEENKTVLTESLYKYTEPKNLADDEGNTLLASPNHQTTNYVHTISLAQVPEETLIESTKNLTEPMELKPIDLHKLCPLENNISYSFPDPSLSHSEGSLDATTVLVHPSGSNITTETFSQSRDALVCTSKVTRHSGSSEEEDEDSWVVVNSEDLYDFKGETEEKPCRPVRLSQDGEKNETERKEEDEGETVASGCSTLSDPQLAGQSSSETSTPEELRTYEDSSSGVESHSDDIPTSPPTTLTPDPDLGIHMGQEEGGETPAGTPASLGRKAPQPMRETDTAGLCQGAAPLEIIDPSKRNQPVLQKEVLGSVYTHELQGVGEQEEDIEEEGTVAEEANRGNNQA
ncbi:uncharacterized protein LOC128663634 [Bombina bombina]|uniref:uncharacterized protein LOC128663634 n=1 Tax=Bombina bombina TaxID=8345 RepID=UPI00235B10CE|nr:uncharacterized protein LOC128663634 [Bombina bombina]